jgi:hypothetical protein
MVGMAPLAYIKKLEPASTYVGNKQERSPSNAVSQLKEPDVSSWIISESDKVEWRRKFDEVSQGGRISGMRYIC